MQYLHHVPVHEVMSRVQPTSDIYCVDIISFVCSDVLHCLSLSRYVFTVRYLTDLARFPPSGTVTDPRVMTVSPWPVGGIHHLIGTVHGTGFHATRDVSLPFFLGGGLFGVFLYVKGFCFFFVKRGRRVERRDIQHYNYTIIVVDNEWINEQMKA